MISLRVNPIGTSLFAVTLFFVFVSVTIAAFPFLIPSMKGDLPISDIDPLEPSIKTLPIIVSCIITLGLFGLYLKNSLPKMLEKAFRFVFSFEVSRGIAFLVLLVFLGFYILFNVEEVLEPDQWDDFRRVVQGNLEDWKPENVFRNPFSPQLVYLFGNLSMDLFGTYRLIPFLSTITLVVFTYLLTLEITKKRFAGLVSSAVLLQSGIFLLYDTTITYTNFWVLFFVISLYCVFKFWPASPVSFILTIPSKAITVLFLPISVFFVWRAQIAKKRKIILCAIYGAMILGGMIFVAIENPRQFRTHEFDSDEFWTGFTAVSLQMRNDTLILSFLVPLTVGLYMVSRRGVTNSEGVMALIFGIILLAPLLPSITDYTNNPYRFLTLSVFFAVGVGTLLSKIPKKENS